MNQKNNYLIIYVKYISSLNTLQAIADLFGVCETTVHFIVKYVETLKIESGSEVNICLFINVLISKIFTNRQLK